MSDEIVKFSGQAESIVNVKPPAEQYFDVQLDTYHALIGEAVRKATTRSYFIEQLTKRMLLSPKASMLLPKAVLHDFYENLVAIVQDLQAISLITGGVIHLEDSLALGPDYKLSWEPPKPGEGSDV